MINANSGNSSCNYSYLRLFSYLLFSTIWFGVTCFLANNFATNHFWYVLVSVLFFSIPIILSIIYSNTIKQIRKLNIFSSRGWLFRFIASRPLKIIFWILCSITTSFFILVQFHAYTHIEWLLFFLVIPVFWFVYNKIQKILLNELKPYLIYGMAIIWSRRVCPFIMLLLYFFSHYYFGEVENYTSLQEAVNSQKAVVSDMTGSALVQEVSQYLSYYAGIKSFAIYRLKELSPSLPLLLLSLGNLIIYYSACAIFSCFLIPLVEYRRIFGPLSCEDSPRPVLKSRIAAISAVTAFISLFIYIPIFSYLELNFQQKPELAQGRINLELATTQRLEQIDNAFFKEGTISQLQNARIEALHETEIAIAHLEGQVDHAFDKIETNVDSYLDWYYSLLGEYTRIATLLVGELEDFMVKKLEESLLKEDGFKEVQTAIDNIFSDYEIAQNTYRAAAQEIMSKNRVDNKDGAFQIVQEMSIEDALSFSIHQDVVNLKHRLLVGGVGGAASGVLTGVIVKKILAKVVSKNTIKVAAKAISKIVISKATGAVGGSGAGAAAGAAIGSFIPILGTAAGAIIGGVIGAVIVGVSVDKLLLELEEAISRDEFKHEILSSIEEARAEFKAKLL